MNNKIDFAKLKNIIFDLDGTLIDSSTGVIESTNYALKALNQPTRSDEEIKRFIGYPLDKMFPAFCDAPVDRLKAAFQVKAQEAIIASAEPLPGVEALLPLIAGRYRLGIATTKFSVHTEGIIKKLGWDDYFKTLVSGNEVINVKPAPDIVELALARLEGTAADTVMIGDTVNDVLAARGAGIKVIAMRSPFGDDDLESSEPDIIIESFADLKRVFDL